MSLINEALKKAQRQRTEGATDTPAGPAGAIPRRSQPRGAKSLVLIAVGAVALVIVSVTITIRLGKQSSPQATPAGPEPARKEPAPRVEPAASPPANPGPAPRVERLPVEKKTAIAETKTAPKANPDQAPPVDRAPTIIAPSPARPPVAATSPTVAASSPADVPEIRNSGTPVASAQPNPEQAPRVERALDERINAYLDTVRITGVKASGTDSRVLMNERVYRLNDFVERTLQLRLIKVETNNLTFSDANGAIYVKYF